MTASTQRWRGPSAMAAARSPAICVSVLEPAETEFAYSFTYPSAGDFARARKQLEPIRRMTSPVFLSTRADGTVELGLGALPPLQRHAGAPAVLFIGNHQLSGLWDDLPLLVDEVHRQTGVLVRSLAHPSAFPSGDNGDAEKSTEVSSSSSDDATDGASDGASDCAPTPWAPLVDWMLGRRGSGFGGFSPSQPRFGAVPVSGRALYRLLRAREPVLLYPGGVREAFKSTKAGEAYALYWPAARVRASDGARTSDAVPGSDFARIAARCGATIVPVAAVGAEEASWTILDADERVRLDGALTGALDALGALGGGGAPRKSLAERAADVRAGRRGERYVSPITAPVPLPGRFYFLFGAPVDAAAVDADDRDACGRLYADVKGQLEAMIMHLRARRDHDPYEPPLPRLLLEGAVHRWRRQVPTFPLP